jgi:4-amino-4-deoxy-L-arabinose transferase-like glycosyltransferase
MAVFALSAASWILRVPFDDAPDEWTHYHYNVRFMLENRRLPVSGVDDLPAYLTGRDNRFGRLSARYSYTVYPALNYILAALTAWVGNTVFGAETVTGARFASLGWGLVFVCALYAACRELCPEDRAVTVRTVAAFALVPQVIYLSAYVNSDIHSLAIAALLSASLARLARRPPTRGSLAGVGISFGLLFSCKLNYFVLVPFAVAAVLLAGRAAAWPRRTTRAVLASMLAGSILLSGFWYARNRIL